MLDDAKARPILPERITTTNDTGQEPAEKSFNLDDD